MRTLFNKYLLITLIIPVLFTTGILQAEGPPNDFRDLAKKAIPAVVSVKVQGKTKANTSSQFMDDPFGINGNDFWQRFFNSPRGGQRQTQPFVGQASGFIISPDGYILTNDHVVKDSDIIIITLVDGRELKAKVIGEDPHSDLAVVKVESKDLPYLKLGNSDKVEVGEWVAAIGNPLGLQGTLTVGVVSAMGRNHLDLAQYEDYIQTDAAINRGNSGGPLLTMNGEVVGINTAIATNGDSGGYMGIGFAIPSNMAKMVMDQLIATGRVIRGFIGVSLQKIDNELAQAFGLSKAEGALVADITKGSPADKGGLRQGDIILKYNSQPIENITTFRNAISFIKPGNKLTLTILRDDKQIEIPIEVGSMDEKPSVIPEIETSPNKLGIEVQNLTADIANNLGYSNDTGVVISKVAPGSIADLTGIKQGSLIVSVNKQKVNSVDDYNAALKSTVGGKAVLLLVKQGNAMYFVSLKTE